MTGPKQARQDGGKRFYSWRNKRYWSVTTIISGGLPKPVLVNWAKKFTAEYAVNHFEAFEALVKDDPDGAVEWLKGAAYRERDRAADLGSSVHAACEAFELGKPMPPFPLPIKPHMENFAHFLETYRPKILLSEASVYNGTQEYAGTLDAIATFGRRKLMFDVKTGKSVYPEVALQLAAYRYAEFIGLPDGSEREMPEVDGCAVLHLGDWGYNFLDVQADESMFKFFLYCREVFRFLSQDSKHVIGTTIKPPRKRASQSQVPASQPSEMAELQGQDGLGDISLPKGAAVGGGSTPPGGHSEPEPQVQPQEVHTPDDPHEGAHLGVQEAADAPSGSEQAELLPRGQRTKEQEDTMGEDIFGAKV